MEIIFSVSGKGLGWVSWKILILPILAVIILPASYHQAFGITYKSTLGETGVPGLGPDHFNALIGVAVDSGGKIYIVDSLNHRVQVFDSFTSTLATITINISSIPDEEQSGIAVDSSGDIYVSDTNNHRIEKFSPTGNALLTIGKPAVPG